jgi:hypothetical protein
VRSLSYTALREATRERERERVEGGGQGRAAARGGRHTRRWRAAASERRGSWIDVFFSP